MNWYFLPRTPASPFLAAYFHYTIETQLCLFVSFFLSVRTNEDKEFFFLLSVCPHKIFSFPIFVSPFFLNHFFFTTTFLMQYYPITPLFFNITSSLCKSLGNFYTRPRLLQKKMSFQFRIVSHFWYLKQCGRNRFSRVELVQPRWTTTALNRISRAGELAKVAYKLTKITYFSAKSWKNAENRNLFLKKK